MSRPRLEEHRRLWREKAILPRVYEPWFEALLRVAPEAGRILEVGAGPGFLAERARISHPRLRWIAADLIAAPWNSMAADAGRLPLGPASVDAVVGLDVLHHLGRPAAFFSEVARVVRPGGRLALVEPWITALSYPVYRFFHQEDCALGVDPWDPFPKGAAKDSFDGNAAIPWKMLRRTGTEEWSRLGFHPPRAQALNAFAYLLSLGFRPGSLLPEALLRPLQRLDSLLRPLAPWLGLRASLVFSRLSG
jgi:SAM-dependent methyltransferase